MSMKFKHGEMVRIKPNTHQERMPEHRVGIVVDSENGNAHTKFYNVMFVGTEIVLKFHEMFLESMNESG